MANRALLMRHLFDDVGIDESAQPVGEEVLCDSQILPGFEKSGALPETDLAR